MEATLYGIPEASLAVPDPTCVRSDLELRVQETPGQSRITFKNVSPAYLLKLALDLESLVKEHYERIPAGEPGTGWRRKRL